MPFTLAHPALVLPLRKSKSFSVTALIAGSIVPDFEFFFQLREVENIGHHWYGILLFDVPLALAFCFLFHAFLRNAFLDNAPAYLQSRFNRYKNFNWLQYAAANKLKIAASLFIGIATHLLWDAFTHYDGFFTLVLPFLKNQFTVMGHKVPVYFMLQVFFSVAGMAMVAYIIHTTKKTTTLKMTATSKFYWTLFVTTAGIIITSRLIFWAQYNSFWGVVMAIMGTISYSWMLSTLFYKMYSTKKVIHANTNQRIASGQ